MSSCPDLFPGCVIILGLFYDCVYFMAIVLVDDDSVRYSATTVVVAGRRVVVVVSPVAVGYCCISYHYLELL